MPIYREKMRIIHFSPSRITACYIDIILHFILRSSKVFQKIYSKEIEMFAFCCFCFKRKGSPVWCNKHVVNTFSSLRQKEEPPNYLQSISKNGSDILNKKNTASFNCIKVLDKIQLSCQAAT